VPTGAKDVPENIRKNCDSITGWARLSENARSSEMRFTGVNALKAIAQLHATREQKLSDSEVSDCKRVASDMIVSERYESAGLSILYCVGADEAHIPMLTAVVKRWVNQGSDPNRGVPFDFKGNPAYLAIHCLARIKSPRTKSVLEDLHKNIMTGDYSAWIKEEIGAILDKMDR